MATVVTRAGKGINLTPTEADANFTNINAELIAATANVAANVTAISTNTSAISLLKGTITYIIQSGVFTLPDFSAAEKLVDGTSKIYVLIPDGSAIGDPRSALGWLSDDNEDLSITQENSIFAYVLHQRVRYSVRKSPINTIDVTPPIILSAIVSNTNPSNVIYTCSEPINASVIPALTDLSYNLSKTATLIIVSGNVITITINSSLTAGQSLTSSYVAGINKFQDLATTPNFLANFTNIAITNNVGVLDTTTPTIVSITTSNANKKRLQITFSKTMSSILPAIGDYTISGHTIASSSFPSSTLLEILLTDYFIPADGSTFSYTQGINKLQDVAGNFLANVVSGVITNNVTYLATDTFNRADSTTTIGLLDTGQTWLNITGSVAGIASNKAYFPNALNSGAGTPNMSVFESGASDFIDLRADFTSVYTVGASGMGLVFRYVDVSNYWIASLGLFGTDAGSNANNISYSIYKVVAGVYTEFGSVFTPSGSVYTRTVSVVTSGTSIKMYLNGGLVVSVTDSANQTATKIGIRIYSGAGQNGNADRFDNFKLLQ